MKQPKEIELSPLFDEILTKVSEKSKQKVTNTLNYINNMKTLKDISNANIQAMKDKNTIAKSLFSTFKGAVENELKSSTKLESDIIMAIAKKYTENAKIVGTDEALAEIELLKPFLPEEMSNEDYIMIATKVINDNPIIINEINSGNKTKLGVLVGAFMKESKLLHSGVSINANIVKETFNKML